MITATDFFCGAGMWYNIFVRQDSNRGVFDFKSLHSQSILYCGQRPHVVLYSLRSLGGRAGNQRHGVFAMKHIITCIVCGKEAEAKRRDKKFCSEQCSNYYFNHRRSPNQTGTRLCKHCGTEFPVGNRGDANRRYCSKECAKNAESKQISTWHYENPDAMKGYNKNRIEKDPNVWKKKDRRGRAEALQLLGGKCIVCGADNPNWLHIDYIAGSRGLKYRHPRHIAYIRKHLEEFRILCANHHYELTLTGKIEGTDITQ